MNIVLDTNVLVSGLLSPFGPCGEIARMVSSGELTLSFDARIISEYYEALQRPKFKFKEDNVTALLEHVEFRGKTIASSPLPYSLPDLDDQPFIEVAVASHAVCVVTGNLSHFPAELRHGVKVFPPSGFLSFYKKWNRTKKRTKSRS
ncbi:MAG: putative toxin-antitoxin system toxin component, PIN family [Deltaproteobacteria bacterium]|nr:putative toxin-antitoxin system toxin component, PIN family [Deltaproteobacteria bacterium]